jgi:hypothetical protein
MKDMTQKQAKEEAVRRWGSSGAVRLREGPASKGVNRPGRLARYRCTVGNGGLGKFCSIQGQGDTWATAFADARPTS